MEKKETLQVIAAQVRGLLRKAAEEVDGLSSDSSDNEVVGTLLAAQPAVEAIDSLINAALTLHSLNHGKPDAS